MDKLHHTRMPAIGVSRSELVVLLATVFMVFLAPIVRYLDILLFGALILSAAYYFIFSVWSVHDISIGNIMQKSAYARISLKSLLFSLVIGIVLANLMISIIFIVFRYQGYGELYVATLLAYIPALVVTYLVRKTERINVNAVFQRLLAWFIISVIAFLFSLKS